MAQSQTIRLKRGVGKPTVLLDGELALDQSPSGAHRLWGGVNGTVEDLSGAGVVVGGTLPTTAKEGALWWDTDTAKLFLWDGDQWVVVVNTPGTATEVGTVMPVDPDVGKMWWDTETAKLFLWDGTQWIVVVNTPGAGAGPSSRRARGGTGPPEPDDFAALWQATQELMAENAALSARIAALEQKPNGPNGRSRRKEPK